MAKDFFQMQSSSSFYKDNIAEITEEDSDLITKIQRGDKKSRDKLILKHLRFAVYMAKQYLKDSFEIEDLIQDSLEGLIKAADKVDLEYDNKFTTYARWSIFSQLKTTLNTAKTGVVISRRTREHLNEYIREKFTAKELGKTFQTDYKMELLGTCQEGIPMSNFLDKEDYFELPEEFLFSPTEEWNYKNLHDDILKILNKLSEVERKVLVLHYGLLGNNVKSFREIGVMFNKTPTWAQYIEKKAFVEIKENYSYIKDYLIGA